MTIDLKSGSLRLARGQLLRLRDSIGSTICASEGTLWITEDGSRRDVVLEPGACFRVVSSGLTLVQAVADAQISLA
jgi:hypothetical protein